MLPDLAGKMGRLATLIRCSPEMCGVRYLVVGVEVRSRMWETDSLAEGAIDEQKS